MSVASSKYAGLPDIDTGADVFETPDVPADSSYEHDSESDTDLYAPTTVATPGSTHHDDIVTGRLEPDAARRRFKESRVNGDAVNFSSALTRKKRRPRPMYPLILPDTTSYELLPRGYSTGPEDPVASTSETPIQRLRRLRFELDEVEGQLEKEKAEREMTGAESQAEAKATEVPTGALLAQLRYLRTTLTGLDATAATLEAGATQAAAPQTDDLLKRIGSPLPPEKPGIASTPAPPGDGGGGGAGERPGAETSAAAADLDARLATLERFVGAEAADIDQSSSLAPPLISTLARLEHQMQLLTQPRHLDTVAKRVKTLVGDLERIHEARRKLGDTRPLNIALSSGMTVVTPAGGGGGGGGSGLPQVVALESASTPIVAAAGGQKEGDNGDLPPDALQKIDALFAILPRLEPLLPLAPQLLTRLKTLAPLHADASQFESSLVAVQKEASGLKDAEQGLRNAIDSLTTSVASNEQIVRGNLESLQKRVDEVAKRMEALQA